MPHTTVFDLSSLANRVNTRKISFLCFSCFISIKSQTIMPPISRNRNCRQISLAASVLTATAKSSALLDCPTKLLELTSITVNASV